MERCGDRSLCDPSGNKESLHWDWAAQRRGCGYSAVNTNNGHHGGTSAPLPNCHAGGNRPHTPFPTHSELPSSSPHRKGSGEHAPRGQGTLNRALQGSRSGLSFGLESSALCTTRVPGAELSHTPSRKALQDSCFPLEGQAGRTAACKERHRTHRQPGQEAELTGLATWGFWEHTQSCSGWKSGFTSPGCLKQDVP